MTASSLLEVKGLVAQYGPTRVLHGIDFRVAEGGITTILGANGAGKTTTLRAVCNMIKASGEVTLAGQRIDGQPTETIMRHGVGHVPDGRGTFMNLSVEENLRLGAYTRDDEDGIVSDLDRIYNLFPVLGERRRNKAGLFSGGEQQMLAIGRALMSRPKLLMLDEPSMGLSPIMTQLIFSTVRELQAEGTTVLLVEQNALSALALSDHAYVIDLGRTTLSGTGRELLADPRVQEAYLGEGVAS